MSKSVLEILGVMDREDTITNMLAHGINNNPEFARRFLSFMADKDQKTNFADPVAQTRIKVEGGVPDLVVSAIRATEPVILVIENKIKAEEGRQQTVQYASSGAKKEIRQKVNEKRNKEGKSNNNFDSAHFSFVFLTLNPNEKSISKKFDDKDYSGLLKSFKNVRLSENEILNSLWKEFVGAANAYYEAGKVTDSDLIFEKWKYSENDPLGSNFLHFENTFRKLEFKKGLKREKIFKSKAWTTPVFQAVISKDSWKYPKNPDKKDPPKELGYNIHIEPTLSFLESGHEKINLALHYEQRRYRTGKEEKKVPLARLEKYKKKRDEFKRALIIEKVEEFKVKGGRNQIGVMVMKIDKNMSVSNFRQKFTEKINKISNAVDYCLKNKA